MIIPLGSRSKEAFALALHRDEKRKTDKGKSKDPIKPYITRHIDKASTVSQYSEPYFT